MGYCNRDQAGLGTLDLSEISFDGCPLSRRSVFRASNLRTVFVPPFALALQVVLCDKDGAVPLSLSWVSGKVGQHLAVLPAHRVDS